MSVSNQIKYYNDLLPANVQLVAVSKTRTSDEIMEAYQTGQRIFGENKRRVCPPSS